MIDLGVIPPGSTIEIPVSTFDKDDGSSITATNFAAGDVLIYKDGSTTQRASTNGITVTVDFDSADGLAGSHYVAIDLSDDTTADFYKSGSRYLVRIANITVDGVTVGGWIARFRIGYPNAILNTSIATLSSQTSFTLTSGPAEDDALNGCVVLIHDKASAVQMGFGVVLDYTGSTKTVTLAAGVTFTAAAIDNISFFPPVNAEYMHAAQLQTPGASGGVHINGSNTGTTTFAAVTVTGTLTISDGIVVTRSTGNSNAVSFTGNGTGRGLDIAAGATGEALRISSTAGTALRIFPNGGNNYGVTIDGAGNNAGLFIQGANAPAVSLSSSPTSSTQGVLDISATGVANGAGVRIAGIGSGPGTSVQGGATGNAINIIGGATSGAGIRITTNGGSAGASVNSGYIECDIRKINTVTITGNGAGTPFNV